MYVHAYVLCFLILSEHSSQLKKVSKKFTVFFGLIPRNLLQSYQLLKKKKLLP